MSACSLKWHTVEDQDPEASLVPLLPIKSSVNLRLWFFVRVLEEYPTTTTNPTRNNCRYLIGNLLVPSTEDQGLLGCQNYGPLFGPLNTRCRIRLRNQKKTKRGDHNFDIHPYGKAQVLLQPGESSAQPQVKLRFWSSQARSMQICLRPDPRGDEGRTVNLGPCPVY